MKLIPLLIFLLLTAQGISQVKEDSLLEIWNNSKYPDTTRLKAINDVIWKQYLFSNPDSAFKLAQQQYDLAKIKGLEKYKSLSLHTQGITFYFKGEYEKALEHYNRALTIRENINDIKGIAATLNNIGIIYKEQGEFDKSILIYNRSLKLREQIGDKDGIATSLNNIGNIYQDNNDVENAIECYERSAVIYKELDNKKGIAAAYSNLGNIYSGITKDLDKAIKYYNESLAIRVELGDEQGISISSHNLGLVYTYRGDTKNAIISFRNSIAICKKLGYKKGSTASLNSLGNTYFDLQQYDSAIFYGHQALVIAQDIGLPIETKNAAHALYESYRETEKTSKALEMYELYISNRDSIFSKENQKEILRQTYKYQYETKVATDSILNADAKKIADAVLANEKAENKYRKNLEYFLYLIILIVILFGIFIFNRFRVTRSQKNTIENQKQEVDNAYSLLEEKNTEVLDSINYAKRIQSAILPSEEDIDKHLPNSFILYKPKDIVAGDFYWLETSVNPVTNENIVLFAAADCTGHGVPGAMVSVFCNNGLNRSVRELGITEPGLILDKTKEIVSREFSKSKENVRDGMDIALCTIEGNQLQYAGANNPLWIIRKGELIEIRATRQPIGNSDLSRPYETHTISLQKNDTLYLWTDGYVDQFGGENGKKMKAKALKELLLTVQHEPMGKQQRLLDEAFESWRGNVEQIDDVCVIGVRI